MRDRLGDGRPRRQSRPRPRAAGDGDRMPGTDDGAGQMAQDPYQGGVAADPDGRLTGAPAERSAREELRRRQETMVRVVLRPIGSPLALGFVALAAATLVVSGLASKLVPALVLATTALRFLVTGLYQLTASSAWKAAAGLVGLLLAALAMYAAWAFELEDTAKRTVLPTLRRGKGPMRSTRASSTRWPRSTTR